MIAFHTPSMGSALMISQFLNEMYISGWIEVARYPAYLSDELVVKYVQQEPKHDFYIYEGDGILIETHAGSKSYFFNTHRLLRLNPFYNTIVREAKHLPSQRGSA